MVCHPVQIPYSRGYRALPGEVRLTLQVEWYAFVIRNLTRREFLLWQTECRSQIELEDRLLKETVLEHPAQFRDQPWDWDEVYAGIVQQLIQKILQLSGFGSHPDPDVLSRTEEYLTSEASRYDLIIMTAFNYKLEEVLELDPDHYHKLVGLAQWKLMLSGIDPQIILNPEASRKGGPGTQHAPIGPSVPGQPQYQHGGPASGERRDQVEGAFAFYSN